MFLHLLQLKTTKHPTQPRPYVTTVYAKANYNLHRSENFVFSICTKLYAKYEIHKQNQVSETYEVLLAVSMT